MAIVENYTEERKREDMYQEIVVNLRIGSLPELSYDQLRTMNMERWQDDSEFRMALDACCARLGIKKLTARGSIKRKDFFKDDPFGGSTP